MAKYAECPKTNKQSGLDSKVALIITKVQTDHNELMNRHGVETEFPVRVPVWGASEQGVSGEDDRWTTRAKTLFRW